MSPATHSEPGSTRDILPEVPLSAHTNYMTPHGRAALQKRRDALQSELDAWPDSHDSAAAEGDVSRRTLLERELRWLDHRLAGVIEIDPAGQPADRVAFGATVTVDTAQGPQRWQIVGEDEADTEHGRVSYVSPLARALLGARVGDELTWTRPAGDMQIEVTAIDYDAG